MKRRLKLILIFLPALAGLGASILFRLLIQPELVLSFRVGLGVLALFVGLSGSFLLCAAVLADLRRERMARGEREADRIESEAARLRFLRSLDHSLKNPLAGLQIELANLGEAEDPAERFAAEDNAGKAVARLSRLLADLRKLAELEARTMERWPVDIPGLVEEMIDAACSLPKYAGRSVHLSVPKVPKSLPPVTGDRDLLALLFYNLVENALKFTCRQDAIEVRVHEDGRAILVEVADTGPGIPSDEEEQIFEELYRGVSAQNVEGSGLGLALVRRIVGLHGGSISVRSRHEVPRSTVFTVQLPVTEP